MLLVRYFYQGILPCRLLCRHYKNIKKNSLIKTSSFGAQNRTLVLVRYFYRGILPCRLSCRRLRIQKKNSLFKTSSFGAQNRTLVLVRYFYRGILPCRLLCRRLRIQKKNSLIKTSSFGAQNRTRTGTVFLPRDFKSLASAIPPLGQLPTIIILFLFCFVKIINTYRKKKFYDRYLY